MSGSVPSLVVELGVGVALALVATGARYALTPLIGDIAPYTFVFVAVALATVIAGWRGGLVALIVGQALVWFAILGPLHLPSDPRNNFRGLIVATLSQLVLLGTVALYQREVDRGTADREKRLSLLDDALKEIDHRTRNNYQTVLAMIDLQMRRSSDDNVREALRQVCDRIQAIANASKQLAVRSGGLDVVKLDDHLCGLVGQIERGLARREIGVECDVDEVSASADTATSISIIVNELVTNALKHAFNGEGSGTVRVSGREGTPFELIVADNGSGMDATRKQDHHGLGTRLVDSFARQLGARHQVTSTSEGTTHRLLFPRLD
ncbi:MAG: sensor histidine kinase [Sphingomicrobium sp.]